MCLYTCTVMYAYKVPLHRVFEICKMRFYLPMCIRKHDYHTTFSQYTQYVRHNHSIDIQRDIQHKSCGKNNVTILNRITIHTRLLDTAKLTLLNIAKRVLEINSVQMQSVF